MTLADTNLADLEQMVAKVDATKGTACIAYCFAKDVDGHFMMSVTDLIRYDAAHKRRTIRGAGGVIALQSGPRIAEARSIMVDHFLRSGAEWMFMVDSDMTFPCDAMEKLIEAAHPVERPIVGGLAFVAGRPDNFYPTVFKAYLDDEGGIVVEPERDYPRDAMVKVGATGASNLVIHRDVFRRMALPYPDGFGTKADGTKNQYPWFAEGLTMKNGAPLGEDIAFCRKAMLLDIPIWVHTGIKFGHRKTWTCDEELYDRMRATAPEAQAS